MGSLGCNLVNTASNHSFDFTQANINASVDAWSSVPDMLAVAGQNRSQAEHDTVHVFSVKGVKMAFLAYTSYSNKPPQNNYGLNVFSNQLATNQINQARKLGAEFIIVSMRWGTEYSGEVNSLQKTQAKFLADQGVQLVLGHGPHVLQPVQELTGSGGAKTVVWYSLGNFINSQIPAETQFNGIGVIDIDIASKKLTKMSYLPIYMHYEWTPEQAKAEQLNARHNLSLLLLEQATDQQVSKHQLNTSISAQKDRLSKTLNALGLQIPLITSKEL
jgi:poly-gamma-glutamate synthesis protein (capsule biosynthesis protein)